MLFREAQREYRTWILDSRRWDHYRPRGDDIVISAYPKCGITWTQRIVQLLIFQTPEAGPVMEISAWIEQRLPKPIEATIAAIEAQPHRRFLKSHLPADGLPLYDELRYIHVARDGRDTAMSYHNHLTHLTAKTHAALSAAGLADPAVACPYPQVPTDPAAYFHAWLTGSAVPGHEDGWPTLSFFEFVDSWWTLQERANVLLVHYNDLKADLAGEMARIAAFLEIDVPDEIWPELATAAGFEAMRRDGSTLMAATEGMFEGGSDRFFFAGRNKRWQGIFAAEDLARYEEMAAAKLAPDCARWLERGRLAAL